MLNPRSMLLEGTYINCNIWAGFGQFSIDFGIFWAVFKVGFLQECGISSGNSVCNPAICGLVV